MRVKTENFCRHFIKSGGEMLVRHRTIYIRCEQISRFIRESVKHLFKNRRIHWDIHPSHVHKCRRTY